MKQSQAEALQAALVECQRFVKAAKLALEVANIEDHVKTVGAQKYWSTTHNKETAATKRASMDLTRALARFRRA